MKTYQECESYLYSFISYEKNSNWTYNNKTLNLERFKQFLQKLGNPQFDIKPIHVAGSDGKGSTCAMTASALQAMGFKTGLYTSPHLQNVRERIRMNGKWIPESQFITYMNQLRNVVETEPDRPTGFTTFFELLTAMAFLHFRDEKTDFAVIETGLGGRLDATNVMNPILTVITPISLEHTDKLGDTLEKIAEEKLGITRPNAPIIIARQEPGLTSYLKNRLHNHPKPVVFADESYSILENRLSLPTRKLTIRSGQDSRSFEIPLVGLYQSVNAITALAILETMASHHHIPPIQDALFEKGMKATKWEGRFELIHQPGTPDIVLDVAHTPAGAASLRQSIDEIFPSRKITWITGFSQDKKIREILLQLIRQGDKLILTQASVPRALPVDVLMREIQSLNLSNQTLKCVHPKQAVKDAMETSNESDLIVVTGSLFLVGEVRAFLFIQPGLNQTNGGGMKTPFA